MNDQFTKPNLGKIVRVERERRSLTQERLAEYIRVGVRSIQRLEATGRTSPHTFSQVAKAFQLTPEQLAQRAEEFDLDKSLDQFGKIVRLEERLTGYGLIDALKPAHSLNHETEMSIRESVPREALELCDKLEMLEIWDDLKPSNQHDFAQELTRDIECLHSLGIACFAGKQLTKLHLPKVPPLVPVESKIDWIQAYLLFVPVDYQLIQSAKDETRFVCIEAHGPGYGERFPAQLSTCL
jgi:transcriptional regulator with XRE-family HTH domain